MSHNTPLWHGTLLEHLQINDLFMMGIICISMLWSTVRGFAKESGAVCVWGGSIWFVLRCSPFIVHFSTYWVPSSWKESEILSWSEKIILLIFSLLILNALVQKIMFVLRPLLWGGFDALLGAGFGIFRGYVLLILLFALGMACANDWLVECTRGSFFAPYIVRGVQIFQGYIPRSWSQHLVFEGISSH